MLGLDEAVANVVIPAIESLFEDDDLDYDQPAPASTARFYPPIPIGRTHLDPIDEAAVWADFYSED